MTTITDHNNSEVLAQYLPQELLGEIFERCLPKNLFDHLQPNSSLPPLVLCHVCRSWREAALGTPQLWNELSMELVDESARSYWSDFLLADLNTLEFWTSHMHALLPSLHFRRHRPTIFHGEAREEVSFRTFFKSPAILNAQLLTLDGFSNTEALKITFSLDNHSFNNLEYLAMIQPFSEEESTLPLSFPPCPTLRRLHIDFRTRLDSKNIIEFSCVTLTHLSANLTLGRQSWYAILAQCINMTSCSVVVRFLFPAPNTNDRPVTFHHNLRSFSVRGNTEDISNVFNGFVFPSLIALRLSSGDLTMTSVHQAITATPALKEFHLQLGGSFNVTNFLHQPQESQLAGPLCKFVPSLVNIVFDRITSDSDNILTLLRSSWLNNGWATLSRTQMSVEFIFDEGGPSLAEAFNAEIGRCGSLPFRASARYVRYGLWSWKQLTARDLRDRWDEFLAFSLC